MLQQLDTDILNAIQGDLPLTARPFAAIAGRLRIDEATLLERLRALAAAGYLRRVGAFFDSEKLGYGSTLIAMQVEPARMAEVAAAINRCPLVTHNYQREDEYNLWFTLQTPSEAERQRLLLEWSRLPGVARALDLPALRSKPKPYKLRVRFALD